MAGKAKSNKTILKVETKLMPDSNRIPIELLYNDERFEIKDPVRSMKLFEGAIRWRCKIDNRPVEMFNLDDTWWMENSR